MPAKDNAANQKQQDKRRQRKDQPVDTAGADAGDTRFAPAADAHATIDSPADNEAADDRGKLQDPIAGAERLLNEVEIERRQHGCNFTEDRHIAPELGDGYRIVVPSPDSLTRGQASERTQRR